MMIEERDRYNNTALHLASMKGHTDTVKVGLLLFQNFISFISALFIASAHCKVIISCLFPKFVAIFKNNAMDRHDGVVVRASPSQSVDLGFSPLVES